LLSLRHEGWTISPNFHFGHMAKGFVWTFGDISVEEYVSYWLAQIGAAGQLRREDWFEYFDRLIELRIASEADRDDFDRVFHAFRLPPPRRVIVAADAVSPALVDLTPQP
jgi:hypothetical protein